MYQNNRIKVAAIPDSLRTMGVTVAIAFRLLISALGSKVEVKPLAATWLQPKQVQD
jgi:hypothetical protein